MERVTDWIRGAVTQLSNPETALGEGFAELLLLMAVQFQSGAIKAVADLVRATLGFHLNVPVGFV